MSVDDVGNRDRRKSMIAENGFRQTTGWFRRSVAPTLSSEISSQLGGNFATRVVTDQRPGSAFAGMGIAMLLDRSDSTVVPGGLFGGEVCRVQLVPVNVGALQFSLYFLDVLYAGDHGVAGMAGQALQQLGIAAGSSGVALVGGV